MLGRVWAKCRVWALQILLRLGGEIRTDVGPGLKSHGSKTDLPENIASLWHKRRVCRIFEGRLEMLNRHGDFNFHRGGDADSSTVFHAIAFLVGVLGSILQTKYQSLNKSPFDTHYTLMVAFIVSIIIYISTLVAEMLLKAYRINSAILSNISLLSGALAPVLLTLIIVPPVGWFAFIIWTLLFVKLARDFFCQLYQWFYHAVLQIQKVLGLLLNGNAIGQQNVELPV